MKKLLLFLTLIISVFLSSCSSNNEDKINSSLLEGAWFCISSQGYELDDIIDELYDPINPVNYQRKFIFKKNSDIYSLSILCYNEYSKQWKVSNGNSPFIAHVNGNKMEVTELSSDDSYNDDWILDCTIKIVSLTETELVLSYKSDDLDITEKYIKM